MVNFRRMFVVLVIAFLFFGFNLNVKAAEKYLGEFCWQMDETPPDVDGPMIYKFGVYKKDGDHIVLYGTEDGETAAHGNAEVIGGNIVMTIVSPGYDIIDPSEHWTDFISAVLDPATLNGTFHAHALWSDTALPNHFTGTMTFINCP